MAKIVADRRKRSEEYSESGQTSKMGLFAKIVYG